MPAGVVTLVTFSTVLCCLSFPSWVEISWSRSNVTVFLPVLILGLLELIWIAYGKLPLLPHNPHVQGDGASKHTTETGKRLTIGGDTKLLVLGTKESGHIGRH